MINKANATLRGIGIVQRVSKSHMENTPTDSGSTTDSLGDGKLRTVCRDNAGEQ